MTRVYLLLGANQGDVRKNFRLALDAIEQDLGQIKQVSSLYESESWGFKADPFLNCALLLHSKLLPLEFLEKLLRIEAGLGRIRCDTGGYTSRSMDIDILLWGEETIELPELKVPHPRMHLRRFALLPLEEIGGDLRLPQGKTVRELLAECPDESVVRRLEKMN